ncbi:MAG TPA: ABC transporter permease [Gaiellaceae bacterium]|nr:ABC transporter permease [Gaiellaceae bacterium]
MRTATHTWWMVGRQLRNLMREPIWIALLLIQPMIWLLLYGQLFSRVPVLRGGASTYVEFLLPGIVVMNAFFGGTWAGMAMISDLDRHVVDRFLATPASRLSIVLSQVVRSGLIAMIQAIVILLVGFALGVRVHGGGLGVVVLLVTAALVSMVFSGVSHGIALLVRREATMIAASNFVGLPLMFLSSILITQRVMPHWMQEVSRFNPVNWGVRAARDAVVYGSHWSSVGIYLLLLVAATAATAAFATWTFRAYMRTL